MSKELIELKQEADTLLASIEQIKQESISFAETRGELKGISNELKIICSNLQTVISNSESLINEVSSIAVKDTVKKLSDTEKSITSTVETNKVIAVETKDEIDIAIDAINKKVMIMGSISVLCSVVAVIIAILF